MYVNKFCNIKWNKKINSSFAIANGVGPGTILAGFAHYFYFQDLFSILEKSGLGFRVNGTYAGAFGYSDDVFFLAPTATA